MTSLLSIVVPMMNEEGNVAPLFERLGSLADAVRIDYGMSTEIVVNDNCSSDRTMDELRAYAAIHDPQRFRLRIFRFSRNIGFQKSILVGYRKARGDAVVQIDADLQDPPELILDFLARWRAGNKVVYGIRRHRDENLVMQGLRKLFYRLINRFSEDGLPHDAGDFRLIDRAVVDVVCALHDNDPYLRGAIASLGLAQTGVAYDRTDRKRGRSKFDLLLLAKLAIDGITNHTALPLRLASYVAIGVFFAAILLVLYYLAGWFFFQRDMPIGFMTQTLLQLGTVGSLALLFAVQGFYIQRIYNQVKERPLAIIEHHIARPDEIEGGAQAIEVLWVGCDRPGGVPKEELQT